MSTPVSAFSIAMAYEKRPLSLRTKAKGFKTCARFGSFANLKTILGLSHKMYRMMSVVDKIVISTV